MEEGAVIGVNNLVDVVNDAAAEGLGDLVLGVLDGLEEGVLAARGC